MRHLVRGFEHCNLFSECTYAHNESTNLYIVSGKIERLSFCNNELLIQSEQSFSENLMKTKSTSSAVYLSGPTVTSCVMPALANSQRFTEREISWVLRQLIHFDTVNSNQEAATGS